MRKEKLPIVITLLFLSAWLSLPEDLSYAADSKSKYTLQYFVDRGRLPDGVKKKIEESSKADVIITLDGGDVKAKAKQLRKALGLRVDNAQIIAEKSQLYNTKKTNILSQISTLDYTMLKDWRNFPVIYVEVNEDALMKLLQSPEVALIAENKVRVPLLNQSLTLVGAPYANNYGATGSGTSVAVVDTGVNYELGNFGPCTNNQLYPDDPDCKVAYVHDFTPSPDGYLDDLGHGTVMSAIVVAVARDTKILGLDVRRIDGTIMDDDVLSALYWVSNNISTHHIQVVNLSIGGQDKFTSPCLQSNLAAAISDLKDAGVVSVAASGNDGFTDGIIDYACIPTAISVGSVYDASFATACNTPAACCEYDVVADQVPCGSNSASFLTMLAPGYKVEAAGYYGLPAGTSSATAHVSGAVAAIRDVIPGLSVDGVRALLTRTSSTLVQDTRNSIVKPRLDLYNATPITCASNPAKIQGGSSYASLQAAYDAAGDGATIMAHKTIITGNLNANRNISVTLLGGWTCDFGTRVIQWYSYVKGSIHRTAGSLTIKNVILIP